MLLARGMGIFSLMPVGSTLFGLPTPWEVRPLAWAPRSSGVSLVSSRSLIRVRSVSWLRCAIQYIFDRVGSSSIEGECCVTLRALTLLECLPHAVGPGVARASLRLLSERVTVMMPPRLPPLLGGRGEIESAAAPFGPIPQGAPPGPASELVADPKLVEEKEGPL